MTKKIKIPPDQIELFQQLMKDVKPLKHDRKIRVPPKIHQKPKVHPAPSLHLEFDQSRELPDVKSEEFIAYKQASISNKTLRKLRKGQYNVEAVLDLHGETVSEAREAVADFLQECLQLEMRVVLIIHGKGRHTSMPVLKNKLNQWLRETKYVLAFCSATSSHGSRGAVYILLKRTGVNVE